MTVLSYANAFPGIPYPNHLAGQSHPQNYLYPGAVQPGGTATVLAYTMAFPGIAFPQHLAGQTTTVINKLFPGAVQPLQAAPPPVVTSAPWAGFIANMGRMMVRRG